MQQLRPLGSYRAFGRVAGFLMAETDDKTPRRSKRQSLGDCVLRFSADTDDLDKSVNETIDRLQRALAAFKAEWNRKSSG